MMHLSLINHSAKISVFYGDVNRSGIYTNIIREQIPLDTIDFALICEKPSISAFSETARQLNFSKSGGCKK